LNWFKNSSENKQENFAPKALGFESLLRDGGVSAVTPSTAINNTTVLRCVTLISGTIAMLPLNMMMSGDQKAQAQAHPVYRLLKKRPNSYQTAHTFKRQMMFRLLTKGNAYARIVRTGNRPIALIPMDPDAVTPKLSPAMQLTYEFAGPSGKVILQARDVIHLADISDDGLIGNSRIKMAEKAISLSQSAADAADRVFKNGVMVGGTLTHPAKLSKEASSNLRDSFEQRHSGIANAHKWLVLEEGMKAEKWANTSEESQNIENRNHQIEELARVYGVPRPLLMMDETAWGSGIEQLGIFFVQYGLQHYFDLWEQELEVKLLEDAEIDRYYFKFNERALLRGTLKDQADYFAKALGSGGHGPWTTQDEVRDLLDMPPSGSPDADTLRNQGQQTAVMQ
jgi:HK97 family phage portal protein